MLLGMYHIIELLANLLKAGKPHRVFYEPGYEAFTRRTLHVYAHKPKKGQIVCTTIISYKGK